MTSSLFQSPVISNYHRFHRKRILKTIELIRELNVKDIVEVGGHPWEMTSALINEPTLSLSATISAEEISQWTDVIPVTKALFPLHLVMVVSLKFLTILPILNVLCLI